MKIFRFAKKVFFIGLTILSNFTNASFSLNCISMKNQECRLDAIVCTNKQRWNKDKYRSECKELIDKGICDKGFN